MTTRPADPKADVFSTAWEAYRAVVDHDYLWHSLAGEALGGLLDRFGDKPVRFLDLACGDAGPTSLVLAGRRVARYVGVDRSEPALAAARTNVGGLGADVELVASDFVDYLGRASERFDLIYVGMSAHHLGETRLPELFAGARRCLAAGGAFAAFEPFTLPDETRDDHVNRLCVLAEQLWVKMTPGQRALIVQHIRESDQPTSQARWDALAVAAGLGPAAVVLKTPERLYQMVAHRPDAA